MRINGQYFAFVAEKGDGGTTVAQQRPVQLGAIVGNDYVVPSGLKAGEQLIVVGHAEDRATARRCKVGAADAAGATRHAGRQVDVQRRLHPPADPGDGLLAAHHPRRRDRRFRRCRSRAIPELAPPSVTVTAFYTGANAQAVESAVTTPLEQAINGVEGMTYMHLVEHQQRRLRRSR